MHNFAELIHNSLATPEEGFMLKHCVYVLSIITPVWSSNHCLVVYYTIKQTLLLLWSLLNQLVTNTIHSCYQRSSNHYLAHPIPTVTVDSSFDCFNSPTENSENSVVMSGGVIPNDNLRSHTHFVCLFFQWY